MKQTTDNEIAAIVQELLGDTADENQNTSDFFLEIDRKKVVDMLEKLQSIIFPEFFKNTHFHVVTKKNHLTVLVEDVLYNLTKQIAAVLRYEKRGEAMQEALDEEAREIALRFMKMLPKVREVIRTDVEALYDGDPAAYNTDEIVFAYPGLYAILVHRLAHELHLLGIPMLPRIMSEHAHSLTGIDIHPGATIGRYFFIDHGTGIVVGETTVIGEHVKLFQGVTLGALSTRGGQALKNVRRHPTIEDEVTIYSGASILGGNTVIGKGAVIGGNAFITSSVPAGSTVTIKNQEHNVTMRSSLRK